MPKLITPLKRIANLGKPKVIVMDEGFGDHEITSNYTLPLLATRSLKTSSQVKSHIHRIWMQVHLFSINGLKNKLLTLMSGNLSFLFTLKERLIIGHPMVGI